MPPLSRQPRLRLVQRRGTPEDVLLRANKHLSEGQPEKAIKLYTEVLYKLSTASVCALLNRSLAYSCIQLPELAVVDAYRAGIVANQMRENADNGLVKYQAATKYLRTEGLHVDGNEAWTSSRRRFVRGDWAYTPLSSIVINDVPENGVKDKYEPFSIHKRQVVCIALEIRAIYRLCGALYLCGGGARSDALGLIDDTVKSCKGMEDWEWVCFQSLGNMIISNTMQPWDDGLSDPQSLVSMSKSMRRKQEEEKQKTKEGMRAKTTSMKLMGYHMDVYKPELDNTDWQQLLRSWVHKSSSNCTPFIVETGDIWDETATSYAELRADRDVNAGELILTEQTVSNVTTSIPEDIFENQYATPSRRYYCDTCASLLIVPTQLPVRYKGTDVPIPTPSPPSHSSITSESSMNAAHGSDNGISEHDPLISSQRESDVDSPLSASELTAGPPSRPPDRTGPNSTAPSDFLFCCPTHDVPTCSSACRKSREPFDLGLCHTSTERELRNDHLIDPPTSKPLDNRKRQCLVDLLFLRIFVKAFNKRSHPLQDSDVVFATCGPNHQGAPEEERTWSFSANVVRPIHHLDQFFEQIRTDQFAQLDKCDGWIINTLMSKISTSMRVSKSPRYAKVFNLDGNIVSAFTPFDQGWNDIMHEEPLREDPYPWKDKDPWIGSIHSIFNMIRIANPAKGETPNVVVVQREGLQCYAVSKNGLEPAIEAGQPLLRAADGLDQEGMVGTGMRQLVVGRGEGGESEAGGAEVMEDEGNSGWVDENDEGADDGGDEGGGEDTEKMDVDVD